MIDDIDMIKSQLRFLERENRKLRKNLRDEYAQAALTGIMAKHGVRVAIIEQVRVAFLAADVALEQRQ